MYFDCNNEFYKKPYGAVKCNTAIKFCITVPVSMCAATPYLIMQYDGEAAQNIPMQKQGVTAENEAVFGVDFTPHSVGLYFYYFDLYVDFNKIYKGSCGKGVLSKENLEKFQLTVYEQDFCTPGNFNGGVMYQIFPDRFYESRTHTSMPFDNRIYRTDKDGEPYFWPNELGGYLNMDYFGGDLQGIIAKLPYLQSLGVTCIYLNPIFEAHSNHRYNTADYLKIDPLLGTEKDFIQLCAKAKELCISIILDGVFSHTGDDSIYFNKQHRYGDDGAFNNVNSIYRKWYDFSPEYPCGYRSWWGFESLPEANETNTDFINFICGDGGVIDKWLSLGADGFRLDVADELPDDFIAKIRIAVKKHGQDKLLLGEVWEDATNKFSYGKRRSYLWGHGLDSVMNYPFRNAIIDFIKYGNFESAVDNILEICQNYPLPALNNTMNFLSTHDTERIITVLADEECDGHDRYWQSGRRVIDEKLEFSKKLLSLAYAFLFFLPGIPCIYYGDEIAMQGYKDPFNRGYYNWAETDDRIKNVIKALSHIRKKVTAFKDGKLTVLKAQQNVIALCRTDNTSCAAILLNRTSHTITDTLLGKPVNVLPYNFKIVIQKQEKG